MDSRRLSGGNQRMVEPDLRENRWSRHRRFSLGGIGPEASHYGDQSRDDSDPESAPARFTSENTAWITARQHSHGRLSAGRGPIVSFSSPIYRT
ncbi:hypothetical protein WCLP8_250003 [uncultured Gammaproteobacteria bacterium]